ncbi:MAG: type II secretion system protein GspC [Granulosicoccus sp.]|nr:type II secretion system protein GspC [Granulosicoccus sp.]
MSATASSLATADRTDRLPRLTNSLLVVGIGIALALITLKLLPASEPAPLAAIEPVSGLGNSAPAADELAREISSLHLFGDASQKPVEVVVEEKQEKIEDTSLNLQLAGVFAFEPAELAIAIISAGSAEQNAYGIGDKISGETTLEAVYPDHVVLRNRGKLEKLGLPENSQPIAMRPVERVSSGQNQSQNEDLSQPLELPSNPRELRDTLARNPSMLGRVVAAEPYQENGKLVGYRITPKQNPEILEAQGIVAGDVITRVNNIQLNSQKQGIRALRNAVKAENLEVIVLRDGVEVPVSISLAQ